MNNDVSNHLTTTEPTMTSLSIAELVRKRHSHVVRNIEVTLNNAKIKPAQYKTTYKDTQNKSRPCYTLPTHLALLVISRFSIALSLKAFRTLELLNLKSMLEDMDVAELPPDRFVYVAMEIDSGRYKVGISKHPEDRVRQLNQGNPEKLVLVHAYLATEKGFLSEKLAHEALSNNHLRSEWFDAAADLTTLPSYSVQ